METWTMVGAKRARNAERPTQPSLDLTSRAPWFYPDPHRVRQGGVDPSGDRPCRFLGVSPGLGRDAWKLSEHLTVVS
jgi:hypothetical protein